MVLRGQGSGVFGFVAVVFLLQNPARTRWFFGPFQVHRMMNKYYYASLIPGEFDMDNVGLTYFNVLIRLADFSGKEFRPELYVADVSGPRQSSLLAVSLEGGEGHLSMGVGVFSLLFRFFFNLLVSFHNGAASLLGHGRGFRSASLPRLTRP